jgi:16S rRNA (uracil1498-N3)-methyltransferase
VLSGPEGRHATTVRRLTPGERADITDGAGTMAACVVAAVRPGTLELTVLDRRYCPPPIPAVTVVQAIPKGDRGEQAVETMTEVGVDVIVPWAAERCVAQWRGEKAARNTARWQATAVAAAKQSRRSRLPEIALVATTAEVTARVAAAVAAGGRAVLLDPDADQPLAAAVTGPGPRPDVPLPVVLLIVGPEGGISPAETAALLAAGAVGARLGPTVLRAASAGAVSAALVMSTVGRWA